MKYQFTTIFKAVKPAEQAGFRQYIHYFYSTQKAILNTFDIAANAVADNDEKGFLLSIKNDKKKLNDLSDLKKWLFEYLAVEEVRDNTPEAKFLTLEALQKRQLHGAYADKSADLKQDLAKKDDTNIWRTLMKLRLDHAHYFNTENDKLDDYKDHILSLLDGLDNFYISTKLKYSAELYNRTNIVQEEYNPRLLTEILLLIKNETRLNPLIKSLYFPLLQLIRDKSETAFYDLKTFLVKNPSHDRLELLSLVIYLLNFAAFRIRQGDNHFYNAYFEIAEIGVSQSLFIASDYFPTSTFNNIVNAGCALKKYDWVINFINQQSIHLKTDENKEITIALAKARVAFEKKEFNAVIDALISIKTNKKTFFSLQMRVLFIRTYYEQKDVLNVQNCCNSMELFVRRTKNIADNLKESTLNFIKIMRLLISKKSEQKLRIVLEEKKKKIIHFDWLKAKIDSRKF